MHKPVTLDETIQSWNEDNKVDDINLSPEMSRIPNLHAKYVEVMTRSMITAKKLTGNLKKLRKYKFMYYTGKLNSDPELLEKLGWEPLQEKVLKSNVNIYIDGDDEVVSLESEIAEAEQLAELAKSIVRQISERTWQIRAKMDFEKFTMGAM